MTNTIKKDDSLASIANRAGKKLREEWDDVESEITDAKASVIKHVRSKPIQSSLIAAGIGFIIGALFRR